MDAAVPGELQSIARFAQRRNPGDLTGVAYKVSHQGVKTDQQKAAEQAALPDRVTELERVVEAQRQTIRGLMKGLSTHTEWLSEHQGTKVNRSSMFIDDAQGPPPANIVATIAYPDARRAEHSGRMTRKVSRSEGSRRGLGKFGSQAALGALRTPSIGILADAVHC